MTAQPVDPQQASSPRIAETAAPAAWLKAALSPWRRLMSLGGALVIADTVPAVGFAAGLALAVGALPRGLAEAVPGLVLAVVALIVRAALSQGAVFVNTRAARAAKNGLRRRLLTGALGGRLSDAAAMTAAAEGVETLDGHVARFTPAARRRPSRP